MRHIGNLPDESQAQRFEDFLLTQDIRAKIEPEDEEWAVWVYDEDHVDRAREEMAEYRENPADSRYTSAAVEAEQVRRQELKRIEQYKKNQVDVRRQWNRPMLAQTPVTTALIAGSILVAAVTTDWSDPWRLCDGTGSVLPYLYIAPVYKKSDGSSYWYPRERLNAIRHGEIWRVFTPMFLHFSILHILFNMMWLRMLGSVIEMRAGPWRYLGMVLLIDACSNLGQYFYSGPAFGGMSGVIYGLFGYIWMKSRFDPQSGYYLPSNIVFLMVMWMIFCFAGFFPVANTAHVVGLLIGAALGLWTYIRKRLAGRA